MFSYHCLNPIAEVGLDQFSTDYKKVEAAVTADAILVRSAAMHDMEFGSNLQAIARAGAGVNNIPLERCAKEGIVVFNTPGANANGVKELVFAGMLLASRDIVGGIEWVKSQSGETDIAKMADTRKLLSPVVEKSKGRYRIRFCFEEKCDLVQNENPLGYTILSVDLGINASASYSVMTADGSVHARGVIHLPCDEDRLERMINRKRMYQQAGKKSRCIYRMVRNANELLSIHTAKAIMETAILYSVDCIVFEYLDLGGRKHGKYRERLHMWRANDVQDRVTLQAHRHGMRISRVCAWGTSKLAFDGSGRTDRRSVYRYVHGEKKYNYSLCTFTTGKIYNCDLNAAYNIGARFFLREYAKLPGCPVLPKTPQRTLATLKELCYSGSMAA